MKRLIFVLPFAALASAAFAGDVKLENKWATSDYTFRDDPSHPTMAQCYKNPAIGPAIAKATSEEAIAEIAGCEDKMARLCAKVSPGYATDPVVACQIAAVSAYVMENACAPWYAFWRPSRADARAAWRAVLMSSAKAATDDYVACYFLDQLRWCGDADDATSLRQAFSNAKSRHVGEMADLVASELESR